MIRIITLITLLICSLTFGQNNYENQMQNGLKSLEKKELSNAVAVFEKLANENTENWLPNYYVALANTLLAFENEKNPELMLPFLEKAQKFQDICNNLEPENAEILAVQAMIHTASIVQNPMKNGRFLSQVVQNIYEKAEKIAPNNPRIAYLKIEFEIGMAKYMGGGTKHLLKKAEEAVQLFTTFEPESKLHPNWGLDRAIEVVANCK